MSKKVDVNYLLENTDTPSFKVETIPNDASQEIIKEITFRNYVSRVQYIHKSCCKKYPEIGEMYKVNWSSPKAADDVIQFWKRTLSTADGRLFLNAVLERAIAYISRPPEFVELDLTDIDYIEACSSIELLKTQNQIIESEVNNDNFRNLPVSERRSKLINLFKQRDDKLHPLIFITTLNANDLSDDLRLKLNAIIALGKLDDARILTRKLVKEYKLTALSDYRKCIKDNISFNKIKYRNFS